MAMLVRAIFESTEKDYVVVSMARFRRKPDDEPTWVVTVRSSTNVLLFRRFTSLDRALGFAAEALPGCAS